jgi:two-component system response regulator PilR (NtrC family)
VQRLNTKLGTHCLGVERDALWSLIGRPWKGNVRELENVLERALTLCADNEIDVDDLQLRSAPDEDEAQALEGEGTLGSQLEHIERDAIVKALEQTRYNKTAAAKLLGISFRALRYRIKKLEIES